jgi:hypothetical protein
MPAYSSRCNALGRGSRELTRRRPPSCFSRYLQNCRTNPSSKAILPSFPVYLATLAYREVAPSPPRDASTTAAHRFASASPWAYQERLHHVRAPSKTLPDGLRLVKGMGHRVIPLALVDKIVAMPAQEVASRPIQNRNPPAASRARTDKLRLLPPKLHAVQLSGTDSLKSSHSPPGPLRCR